MMKRVFRAALSAGLLFCAGPSLAQGFQAEGGDTVFGMSARQLSLGGGGVASARDAAAVYYNPALLTGQRPNVTLSRLPKTQLRPYSYAGAVLPLPSFGLPADLTLGVARYPRVHVRKTGVVDFDDGSPQSLFLKLLLPNAKGKVTGQVDSKTMVNRIALGVAPHATPRLRFGINVDLIDCKTSSCGVQAKTGKYTIKSAHAQAASLGVGVVWQATKNLRFAASWSDINTTLHVDTTRTVGGKTTTGFFTAKLPSKLMLGASYTQGSRSYALDYVRFQGTYGALGVDMQTLHLGVEQRLWDHLSLRAGALVPITLQSTGTRYNLPVPFAPTLGAGWDNGRVALDAAVFANPLMTFDQKRPVISADLSATIRF